MLLVPDDDEPGAGRGRGRMEGMLLAESGSCTSRGRSPLRTLLLMCKGGGLAFRGRWDEGDISVPELVRLCPPASPDDTDVLLSPYSPLTYTLGRTGSNGVEVRVEHFCRRFLTALTILSLSPILAIPISFNVT